MRRLAAGMLGWVLALLVSAAGAQTLESVLAPGKLIQGHAKWDDECSACHVRFDRGAQDRLCMDCHKDVGHDVRSRAGYHGRVERKACRSCHTDHKGRDARIVELDRRAFDHALTDYALRGKHRATACDTCHEPAKKWRDAPSDCNACHRKDDVHKGALGTKCADCHGENDWKEAKFDHDKTRYALTGKHVETKCVDCHRKGADYKDAPRACIGCHRRDDEGAKGHKGQYGERCESCHGTKGWKPSTFDHDRDTRWALRGKHRATKCADCHTGHLYRQPTKTDCWSCHRKDDKHAGTLGTDCGACHAERDWKTTRGRFDHDRTKFRLRNAHAAPAVKCSACHRDAKSYRDTPTDCIACHRKDDRHEGQQGRECRQCHDDASWKVPGFDHARTRFPLVGRHVATACRDCHATARYKDAPRDCWSCHRKDDRHKLVFGTKCESCHNARAWSIWDYDHDRRTRYRLDGAHRKAPCEACHTRPAPPGRDAALLDTQCLSCHRKDDVHDGGFGARCEQCHATDDWKKVSTRRRTERLQ